MEELPKGQRSAAKVGRELGINERVAQRWWKKYDDTGELPLKKTSRITGRPHVFAKDHKKYVKDLVDENPQTTITDVMEDLTKEFVDLSISKTQLHHHMKTHLASQLRYPLSKL